MKINLRADSASGQHTTFTVFINGANCGQLTMKEDEAYSFQHRVALGCIKGVDEFSSTGRWMADGPTRTPPGFEAHPKSTDG